MAVKIITVKMPAEPSLPIGEGLSCGRAGTGGYECTDGH